MKKVKLDGPKRAPKLAIPDSSPQFVLCRGKTRQ